MKGRLGSLEKNAIMPEQTFVVAIPPGLPQRDPQPLPRSNRTLGQGEYWKFQGELGTWSEWAFGHRINRVLGLLSSVYIHSLGDGTLSHSFQ